MDDSELLDFERAFWTSDASFYDDHLTAGSAMVFPGLGFLDRSAVIEGLRDGPRWRSVSISDAGVMRPSTGLAIVSYEAQAMREGDDDPYRAYVSSLYVEAGDGWKLAFHQHTPVG